MALTVWTVIYSNQTSVFAYDQNQMISYVFMISVLQSLILSTALHGLASDIYSGQISQILIKPVAVFGYFISLDVADKLKNVLFSGFEIVLLAMIFQPVLPIPSLSQLFLGLVGIALGACLYFFVILLFGTLGFWSPETWGPRFLFFMFVDITAGKLFPLDILPMGLQKLLYATPFPYLSFVQIQTLLGRMSTTESLQALGGVFAWTVGLAALFSFVWTKGIKEYTAAGI